MLWGSGTIDPRLEPYQCLFTSMWIRMAWLPCWQPRGQQVLHQRWIWRFHCTESIQVGWGERSILVLKPKADITRSPKQWYQWPHIKDWYLPKKVPVLSTKEIFKLFSQVSIKIRTGWLTIETWARFLILPWERAILNMSLHDKLITEVLKTYEGIYFRYPEIIALSKIIALNFTLSECEVHDAFRSISAKWDLCACY